MSSIQGRIGENLAVSILLGKKYEILERNYRSRFGEIDIIAEKEGKIHFIEVKYRKDRGFGLPSEFVTKKKIDKILKTAKIYLSLERKETSDWQIDVVAIDRESGDYEVFENVLIEGLA